MNTNKIIVFSLVSFHILVFHTVVFHILVLHILVLSFTKMVSQTCPFTYLVSQSCPKYHLLVFHILAFHNPGPVTLYGIRAHASIQFLIHEVTVYLQYSSKWDARTTVPCVVSSAYVARNR